MRIGWFRRNPFAGDRLVGARVYLRPARNRDYRAWANLRERSRAFLIAWEPAWAEDALTRAAFRRRVVADTRERGAGSGFAFLIFRREDDALLGGIGLGNVRQGIAQSGSIGYWLGEPYARQGYMADAMTVLLRFAFRNLGLHRVDAACLPENIASRRLLGRRGFREEGRARRYLRINGDWADHLLFALLEEDFERDSGVADGAREKRGVYA